MVILLVLVSDQYLEVDCEHFGFPQCVLSCEDQDCVLLGRLYHNDCIDMGSRQCVPEKCVLRLFFFEKA